MSHENLDLPDWELIDEISIPLLEQGIGTFETLQRALPSVVFAEIRSINDNDEDCIDKFSCSTKRFLKLFRIAQLQLSYVLRTQHRLLDSLEAEKIKCKRLNSENKLFQRTVLESKYRCNDDTTNLQHSLYRCSKCSKIFLNNIFFLEHLRRKHDVDWYNQKNLSINASYCDNSRKCPSQHIFNTNKKPTSCSMGFNCECNKCCSAIEGMPEVDNHHDSTNYWNEQIAFKARKERDPMTSILPQQDNTSNEQHHKHFETKENETSLSLTPRLLPKKSSSIESVWS